MYKLLFYTAAWQRREITRLCYEGIKRLQAYKSKEFSIECLVIASTRKDLNLAAEYGFHVVTAPNKPLGAKHNAGLPYALELPWDYLVQIGSDDILSRKALNLYAAYWEIGVDIVGLDKLAFVNADTHQAKVFNYHTMIGGGRAIKRSVIEDTARRKLVRATNSFVEFNGGRRRGKGSEWFIPVAQKKPFTEELEDTAIMLWEPGIDSGLDKNSENNMLWRPRYTKIIEANDPLLVDIKRAGANIHAYENFDGVEIPIETLYNDFPELQKIR